MKKAFLIAAIVLGSIVFTGLARGNETEQGSEMVLATAPGGSFRLVWKEPKSAIDVVTDKERTALPAVEVRAHEYGNWASGLRNVSSASLTEMPLTFISPDERWIFVQLPVENQVTAGCLYRRADIAGGTVRFELAASERFDTLAWRHFAQEHQIDGRKIGVESNTGDRYQTIAFGGWSADSGRLLFQLNGKIGSPKQGEYWGKDDAGSWLCYFNTRTGTFERTPRLEIKKGDAVLTAESIGKEGPEIPAKQHFEKADAALNNVYGKLVKTLDPAGKATLQQEEREWLKQRDLFASIYANQSWSLFPAASETEGSALATEERVAALEKRLER